MEHDVIHAGCTVGLQSMLCKVPTIDITKMFNDLRKEALSTKIAEYRPINMSEFKETMKMFLTETLPCMQEFEVIIARMHLGEPGDT